MALWKAPVRKQLKAVYERRDADWKARALRSGTVQRRPRALVLSIALFSRRTLCLCADRVQIKTDRRSLVFSTNATHSGTAAFISHVSCFSGFDSAACCTLATSALSARSAMPTDTNYCISKSELSATQTENNGLFSTQGATAVSGEKVAFAKFAGKSPQTVFSCRSSCCNLATDCESSLFASQIPLCACPT